jgi:hypothetical protein
LALADMQAGNLPAAALGGPELRRLIDGSANAAGAARHRFGALSRFLDWCQDAGHIQANPCTLIPRTRRPRAVQGRSHYLTPAELARLWQAADRLGEVVWRDFARFLIAVPCRRAEAAKLDWSHLDLVAAEWRQPGHMTKNREAHRLHLHPLALEVLRERHKATGGKGLVFPAPRSGDVVKTFAAIKDALIAATSTEGKVLTGWNWHDTRRVLRHRAGRGWRIGDGGGCGAEPSAVRDAWRRAGHLSAGQSLARANAGDGPVGQDAGRCDHRGRRTGQRGADGGPRRGNRQAATVPAGWLGGKQTAGSPMAAKLQSRRAGDLALRVTHQAPPYWHPGLGAPRGVVKTGRDSARPGARIQTLRRW